MQNLKIFQVFSISLLLLVARCKKKEADADSDQHSSIKSISEKLYLPVEVGGNWEKGDLADTGHSLKIFDDDGIHFQTEHYDENMMLTEKVVFFRVDGKVVSEEIFDSEGAVEMKKAINQISESENEFEIFNGEGQKLAWGKLKLKDENPLEETFSTEHGTTVTKFIYDEQGNVLSISTYNDENGTEFHRSYEYLEFDERGNWTKSLVYMDGELMYISIREITY